MNVYPITKILEEEYKDSFRNFCSLMCIMHNKKLNYASILISILKNEKLRTLYKSVCDIESDYEAIKLFLDSEPQLHKSKYVKKYLNNNRKKIKFDRK
jgi:hypothetical protein